MIRRFPRLSVARAATRPGLRGSRWPLLAAAAGLGAALAPAALAQEAAAYRLGAEAVVGSEAESYLRLLQVAGLVPSYPWSIRGFSPSEVQEISPAGDHPWRERYAGGAAPASWIAPLPVELTARYNSAFPYGRNDGPVWAGRGFTMSAGAGAAGRAGPLAFRIAPQVFWAENRDFPLMPHGDTLAAPVAHARSPQRIDNPQRFGVTPYARVDPGESYLRLDVAVAAVGVATAAQHWGPAAELPLLLGNNAPGFLHGFVGTSRPVNVGIGRFHGRLVGGFLEQTEYSRAPEEYAERVMSGVTLVLTPARIDGLEIGLARFFHSPRPRDGVTPRTFLKPLEAFFKARLPADGTGPDGRSDPDNQIASVFFRWVLPAGGVEVYGEYGREDHSWDSLDFLLQPDHMSAFSLGFRKVWLTPGGAAWSVGAERLDTDRGHVWRVRGQSAFYEHGTLGQGHTHRGQVLGAASGWGGGGSVVAVDRYSRSGRLRAEWFRGVQGTRWNYWRGADRGPRDTDVVHALSLEAVRLGGRVDVTGGTSAVFNLNRYHEADAFNLNARLGLRVSLH